MTPSERTAAIHADNLETLRPVDRVAERRAGIMDSPEAKGRFALAFMLATHWPLSPETARLVLSAARADMPLAEAQDLAGRLVEPGVNTVGVTRGH